MSTVYWIVIMKWSKKTGSIKIRIETHLKLMQIHMENYQVRKQDPLKEGLELIVMYLYKSVRFI